MNNETKNIKTETSSIKRNELIEGKHFYFNEQGYMVFTELYHTQRGYCCKNGCKHCPY
jgi:surfactin synthase thioesterase subunit